MIKNFKLGFKLAFVYIKNNIRQFIFGLVLSLIAIYFAPQFSRLVFVERPRPVGIVGNYVITTLPKSIQNRLSYGLVKLDTNDQATAGAALGWYATDSGRTLVFRLDPDKKWQDGEVFKASHVNYNLRGVDITNVDDHTIKFNLKEPFAPLLNLLSQPLFKNGLLGFGPEKVLDVKFNGRFLSSLRVLDFETGKQKLYKFYPSENDAVTALKLGSIKEVNKLHDTFGIRSSQIYNIKDNIDTHSLAVLFFNNQKKPFDDKTFRQGLVYALPDIYDEGETADSPLARDSWAMAKNIKKYNQNTQLSIKLTGSDSTTSATPKIIIATSKELEPVAKRISSFWEKAKIKSEISVTDILPVNYDAYLTYIDIPTDPDQYYLWHSTQTTNIAKYKSFKVDKLLEEGRREVDVKLRKEIYANFLRAITEDVPAAFLFYPKVYTVSR